MYASAISNESPVFTFRGRTMRKSRIPGKWRRYQAAIRELYREHVIINVHVCRSHYL